MTGGIICVTGRPQSGKSTLARAVARRLRAAGAAALVLDGDEVRGALVPAPGYGEGERDAFYATLANLAGVLAAQGVWVVVAATAHLRRYRERLHALAPRYLEVFVDATLEACQARDTKGLYAKFREGLAPSLPGVGATYEVPERPDVVASGGQDMRAVREVLAIVKTADRRHRSATTTTADERGDRIR